VKMIYAVIALLVLSLFAYSSMAKSNGQVEPLIKLGAILSNENVEVKEDLELYLNNPAKYLSKYEDELFERGIEEVENIPAVIVLVNALLKRKLLAYVDGSNSFNDSLKAIAKLAKGKLDASKNFKNLLDYSNKPSKYGVGAYLDSDIGPSVFESLKSDGFNLISINEDSDAYPLVLVNSEDLNRVVNLAKDSNIRLYYADK